MKQTTQSTAFKTSLIISALLFAVSTVSAAPVLDGVSYDPGFITAGDRVNISANLHETDYPDKTWDEDKKLKAVLKPGNKLTRDYVTIEDDRDESIGFLYPEGVWNQRFQVKVDSGAPTGMYDFEIHIQYLENGEPVSIQAEDGEYNYSVVREFSMPVDNEGVDMTADVKSTEPSVPRPGDNYVETHIEFTNTGNKPLEEIEIRPSTPENLELAYSKDDKYFINQLIEGQSNRKTLTLNLDEETSPGLHTVSLSTSYEDESGNEYTGELQLPFRVEGRPDLELVNSTTSMKAGETQELRVKVENTGMQDAESVTARVIAERTQPFSLADRSNYIGEIEAGETREAVMEISADRNAQLKTHQLKIQLRANGDSEEGDQSVYTYTENTQISLTSRTQSSLIYIGVAAALLVLGLGIYRFRKSSGDQDEKDA